jgi:Leucine-rich repeat (LRR) protein
VVIPKLNFLPNFPITLTELDANDCKLKTLPDFPLSIEYLNLSNNEIEELPDNLYRCVNLYQLNVSGNNLNSYPDLPPNVDIFNSDFTDNSSQKEKKILIS